MKGVRGKSQVIEAEVLIVGGGLVGATLACALDAAGLASIVVDHADPAALIDAGFDGRASAVALASQRMFSSLGLWPAMAAEAAPILDIRVSEGGSPLYLHLNHHQMGEDPFGYMVENRVTRRALFERLPRLPSVRWLAPARLAGLTRSSSGVEARLADGRRLTARLVVAADGRASAVRRDAGIRTVGWPYRQTGLVFTLGHEVPHGNVAHEHFLPSGPFAILPMTGNRSSIVWTEKRDLAAHIARLDEAAFLAEVERRVGDFLGRLEVLGPRWAYPLSLRFAETALARRLALVGDAYHAMHPIAGQGLNMGWRDVAALAEVLAEASRLGLDIGDVHVLRDYQRWRRFDNLFMLGVTDVVNRLFSNDIRLLRWTRDLGMAAWGRVGPLSRMSMRQAMGTLGDTPRLLRGQSL